MNLLMTINECGKLNLLNSPQKIHIVVRLKIAKRDKPIIVPSFSGIKRFYKKKGNELKQVCFT